MNEFEIDVDIRLNKLVAPVIELVQNDYNSTKLKFNFIGDNENYTKVLQLQLPDGSMWIKDILNNEVILAGDQDGQTTPILVQSGKYIFDIVIYSENAKLTTTNQETFFVRSELAGQDVEQDDRVPILDRLINETTKVVNEANNLDIDIKTTGTGTTVEITRKDGSKKSATVSGGDGGVGTETDPTVPEHVKNISQEDIENWNNKTEEEDLVDYVKFDNYADNYKAGVSKVSTNNGIGINSQNTLHIVRASDTEIKNKSNTFKPIVPSSVDYAVKSGLVDCKLTWTESEKQTARTLLGVTGVITDLEREINEQLGDIETLLGGI